METLAVQSYRQLSFEEMLLTIYPKDILVLPYNEYKKGIFKSRFYPVPHLVPYAHQELTKVFLERVGLPSQKGSKKRMFSALDLILEIILMKGVLVSTMISSSRSKRVNLRTGYFLWELLGKRYTLYTSLPNNTPSIEDFQTLDALLRKIIFYRPYDLELVDPQKIIGKTRTTLLALREIQKKEIEELRKDLLEEEYFELDEPYKNFSFWPFNSTRGGFLILNELGLHVIGRVESSPGENNPIGVTYQGEDIDLALASGTYNRY